MQDKKDNHTETGEELCSSHEEDQSRQPRQIHRCSHAVHELRCTRASCLLSRKLSLESEPPFVGAASWLRLDVARMSASFFHTLGRSELFGALMLESGETWPPWSLQYRGRRHSCVLADFSRDDQKHDNTPNDPDGISSSSFIVHACRLLLCLFT